MVIRMTGHSLYVGLERAEKLWALKSGLRIPLAAIESIEYTSEKPRLQGTWRRRYLSVPGVVLAGTYSERGTKEFWLLRMRRPGMLSIHIKPGMLKHSRLRLTCSPALASKVMQWWYSH